MSHRTCTRTPCYSLRFAREFNNSCKRLCSYLSASGLRFITVSHIHSWLLLVVPETLGGKCSVVNECNYTHDNGLIYTDNILLVAFQSILSDPDFDVPSQPAIAARKSASLILLWCTTHQDETSAFLSKLQRQLSTCLCKYSKKTEYTKGEDVGIVL